LEKGSYVSKLSALRTACRPFFWKELKAKNLIARVEKNREGDSFKIDEPIYLYIEPIGYTLKENQKSLYEFGFLADFTIESEDGKVLGGQKDFAKLNFKSWNYNTEIALTFTYTISGLEQGKYKIVTVVRDKLLIKKPLQKIGFLSSDDWDAGKN